MHLNMINYMYKEEVSIMNFCVDKLKGKYLADIYSVESRAHVVYIRYLMSKRTPITTITKELNRLGLSSPSISAMRSYFSFVILPVALKYGLKKQYLRYAKKFYKTKTPKNILPILSYNLEFEKADDVRENFCKFLSEIKVADLWSKEIIKYYGSASKIPLNSDGVKIFEFEHTRIVDNVLTCPKRYVIDKLILEDVSPHRIAMYLKEKHNISLTESDIYFYANTFFNFKRSEMESLIEQLSDEQEDLKAALDDVEDDEDLSLGERKTLKETYNERIDFLTESIRDLNSRYSDLSYTQGVKETVDIKHILEDLISRGYEKFKFLDKSMDRDVIKPLSDISKVIYSGVDKLTAYTKEDAAAKITSADKDKDVQSIIVTMYTERYDEVMAKQSPKEEELKSIDIEGLDEV